MRMTTILDRWIGMADLVSTFAVRAAGALILAAAVVVGLDVLLRKIFLMTVGGADELSGYAFAIGTTWALAFTLLRRANVRVDALYSRLPARAMAALDLLALCALLGFVFFLTWRVLDVLQDSLLFRTRANTPLGTPLWIPQSLWLGGFALFLFTAVPLLLRTAIAFVNGDLAKVHVLSGARTLEEDASAEKSHTKTMTQLDLASER